jgi:hypothetical protein
MTINPRHVDTTRVATVVSLGISGPFDSLDLAVLDYNLFGSLDQHVADFRIMRKWKWLLVNGCECRSVISNAAEFLNPYKEGKMGRCSCRVW